MATHPSQMPKPGAFVTPQAGVNWVVPTKKGACDVLDPSTYTRGAVHQLPVPDKTMVRHTTKENIQKFFNRDTYKKNKLEFEVQTSSPRDTHVQKRSNTSPLPGAHPVKRPMQREELIEKFKLAASLNGFQWEELMELWCAVYQ